MSPLKINILLHVYSTVADYRDSQLNQAHAWSDAVREALGDFFNAGLIEKIHCDIDWNAAPPTDRSSQYKITDKGRAMVDALRAVQIPVCKWVQP